MFGAKTLYALYFDETRRSYFMSRSQIRRELKNWPLRVPLFLLDSNGYFCDRNFNPKEKS
jgi:hypothetical protein